MSKKDKDSKPISSSEIQLDKFLRDLETEEGAKRWGKEAYKTAKEDEHLNNEMTGE